jgi:TrmH family RNA methyltransferase
MTLTAQMIKDIRALQTVKGRKASGLFLAEGIRTILTFIEAGHMPVELYIEDKKPYLVSQIPSHVPFDRVSESHMESISASTTPSGILAIFKLPAEPDASQLSAGLVLAQVSDPGNMGTLIRSAAAFGYKSIVVVEGCDPYSPKVVQSTAGSLAHVDLFRWTWNELFENKKDLSLCALVARDGKTPEELDLKKSLLVVGNEAHGIPGGWLEDCDTHLTLPMAGNVESLNAAIAGSIALFIGSQRK